MILYLDTSALIKVYIDESGSDLVASWLARTEETATSVVAYAEAYSAFRRAFRMEKRLGEKELKETLQRFEEDWKEGGYTLAGVSHLVLEKAREVILRHDLKGFDGIHLGTALLLNEHLEEAIFGAFDKKLLQAAEREGLAIIQM